MILGLTGGYCSGKSSVASFLEKNGWYIINVDNCGHEALERVLPEVKKLLGDCIETKDGKANRKAIGKIVFNNPEILNQYENIVHPMMNKIVDEKISNSKGNICIDAALLYTLPVVEKCDAIIEVQAPIDVRIYRSIQRDGTTKEAALSRIKSQLYLKNKGKKYKDKTYILDNCGKDNDVLEGEEQKTLNIKIEAVLSEIDENYA